MSTLARSSALLDKFCTGACNVSNGKPIPLVRTSIDVRILGGMSIVRIVRVFLNRESTSIEATMTFPVPVHAAMVALEAAIDGRRLVGTCKANKQARESYEAALDRGKTAVLHEEALKGIHILSVGQIGPGKEVAVTCTYAITVEGCGNSVRVRIPTSVGDIYGRPPISDADNIVHAPVMLHADVTVSTDRGKALINGAAGDGKRVLLDAPILIDIEGWTPLALRGTAADGRHVTLTVEPVPATESRIDVRIVKDRSGSMNEPIDSDGGCVRPTTSKDSAVRAALAESTSLLRCNDAADIWEYDNVPNAVPGLTFAEAVANLAGPGGSTETSRALAAASAGKCPTDILLITDGKDFGLTANIQTFARAGKRISVVLVGEDALDANVGHLAALTGGSLFATSGSDVFDSLRQAFKFLRTPAAKREPIEDDSPELLRTVIGGMLVEARWDTPAIGIVDAVTPTTIEGTKSEPVSAWISTNAPSLHDVDAGSAPIVGALAAYLALGSMTEENAAKFAESHGIVCHLTSLVLVDEACDVQDAIPSQRKVPLMSPRTRSAAAAIGFPPSACALPEGALPQLGEAPCMLPRATFGANRSDVRVRLARPLFKYEAPPLSTQVTLSGTVQPRHTLSGGQPGHGASDILGTRPSGPGGSGEIPTPPPAPSDPARLNLRRIASQIDWGREPEKLRQGETHGVIGLDLADVIRAVARAVAEVAALAHDTGRSAETIVIALLARKAGEDGDRSARRIARSILGSADPALIDAAVKALDLA